MLHQPPLALQNAIQSVCHSPLPIVVLPAKPTHLLHGTMTENGHFGRSCHIPGLSYPREHPLQYHQSVLRRQRMLGRCDR